MSGHDDSDSELMELLVLLTPPPPSDDDDDDDDDAELSDFLDILMIVPPPPDDSLESIRQRYFAGVEHGQWISMNLFESAIQHPYEFVRITGETPASFDRIYQVIAPRLGTPNLPRNMDERNQILLCMMWLRSYPTYPVLRIAFGVSLTTVSEIINHVWPMLWAVYAPKVEWPNARHWQQLRGIFIKLPNAVGAIDGTSHEIYRPLNEISVFVSQ